MQAALLAPAMNSPPRLRASFHPGVRIADNSTRTGWLDRVEASKSTQQSSYTGIKAALSTQSLDKSAFAVVYSQLDQVDSTKLTQ
jgi:hypothetical protein